MTKRRRLMLVCACLALLCAPAARAQEEPPAPERPLYEPPAETGMGQGKVRMYSYANVDAEYVVVLPDAPLGQTIWAQNGNVPYIDNPPKYGAVGEIATVQRADPDTGEVFNVKIVFVKADHDFLLNLTAADIEKTLKKEFADLPLQNARFRISQGKDTLKWATYSGFWVNRNNEILYSVIHYLVGTESVTVVRTNYSVYNKLFNWYYKVLADSIRFMGK